MLTTRLFPLTETLLQVPPVTTTSCPQLMAPSTAVGGPAMVRTICGVPPFARDSTVAPVSDKLRSNAPTTPCCRRDTAEIRLGGGPTAPPTPGQNPPVSSYPPPVIGPPASCCPIVPP